MRYKVNEIFNSLQGEGYHTGMNCTFIRLSGCNLKCPFCDTQHLQFTTMSENDIVRECKKYRTKTIILTGGEPTVQPIEKLAKTLHQAGYFVCLETNGTNNNFSDIDWVTCSPKEKFCCNGQVKVKKIDELKVVFQDDNYDYSKYLNIKATRYYLQPMDTGNKEENRRIVRHLIDYIKENPIWTLSLQTHKILDIQ